MKKRAILFLISIFILIILTSCSYKNINDSKVNDIPQALIQGKCTEVLAGHNNVDGKKLNIVFIGIEIDDGETKPYKDSFDFYYLEGRSKKLAESIFSIEPYKSNKELINFWNYSDILQERLVVDEKTGNVLFPFAFDSWSDVIKGDCGIVPTQVELVIKHKEVVGGTDQMTFGGQGGSNLNFSISIVTVYDTKDIESYVNRPALQALDHELVFHQLGYTPLHDFLDGNSDSENGRQLLDSYKEELIGANAVCYQPTSENLSEEEAVNECKQRSGWHDLIGNGCGKDGVLDCEEDDINYYSEVSCHKGCAQSDNFYRPLKYSIFLQGDDKTKDYGMYDFTIGKQKMRRVCNKIKDYTGQAMGICNGLCLEGCNGRCINGICI